MLPIVLPPVENTLAAAWGEPGIELNDDSELRYGPWYEVGECDMDDVLTAEPRRR